MRVNKYRTTAAEAAARAERGRPPVEYRIQNLRELFHDIPSFEVYPRISFKDYDMVLDDYNAI